MKTNFTIGCKVLLATLLIFSFSLVRAQSCLSPAMSWRNPTLISGTALQMNAVYKFQSVTPGVYALVTILDVVGGATLTSIDDMTYGYNAAWQPVVKTPTAQVAVDAYVSFKVEFKDSVGNSNHTFNCFQLSYIDVDGDNNNIREFVATKGFDSYVVANNTTLTISQVSGLTQATAALQDYPGLDTTAYRTNINYQFTNKYQINEIRIGTRVNATHSVVNRYTCGYYAQISMPFPLLPLKYLSFDAVVSDNKVTLKWITTQEVNTSHFEVERSFDMNSFSTIGMVLDGFTLNSNDKSYQFKDNSAELQGRSIAYYRLKQFDIDGKVTYSKVLAVRLQAKADVVMQVSPNPFIDNLTARFNSTESGVAQIRISSFTGQTMLSKQSTISKGYNNLQIDGLSGLAAGMYVAQLVINGTVIDNQKIIKN